MFKKDKDKDEFITESIRSAYLKIFLNYLQLVSISNSLDLKWSDLLIGYFNGNLLLSGSVLKVFSLECLFPKQNIVYLNALIMSVFPLALFLFIIVFWFCHSHFKIRIFLKNLNKLIATAVIALFTIQPPIINDLINIISCKEIDAGKFYISSYLAEECNTDNHKLWTYLLFYPAFLFYAIILPLLPFCYILYYKKNLYVNDRFRRVGYLFSGYMKKKFYWEFIFFYRKIIIIIIINYFTMNKETKALMILAILLVSLLLQAIENPYIAADLNSVDFKATFVAFLTIFGGLIAYVSNTVESQMFVSIMIFIGNLLFLYHWIKRFLIQTLPWYLDNKYLKCLQKYLRKLKPEYDDLKSKRKIHGIMGISNDQSSNLDKIPKKTSLFLSFKTAFSNLLAEPQSPKFASKKKLKDSGISFQTFGDFQDNLLKLNENKSKTNSEFEMMSNRSGRTSISTSKFKPKQKQDKIKSIQKLLSLSHIEEERTDQKDEINELRELVHLQNKEIDFLNKKLDKMRNKLKKLRDSKIFTKTELEQIFSGKVLEKTENDDANESNELKHDPKEFNINPKSNYFETLGLPEETEKDSKFIQNKKKIENIEITHKILQESWITKNGVYELNRVNFNLKLKKMPYNTKNQNFVKMRLELTNFFNETLKNLTIKNEGFGDLFICDADTTNSMEIKPKQQITQIIFLKAMKTTYKRQKNNRNIQISFSSSQNNINIKINLPENDKMFVEFLKISENLKIHNYNKYTEEVYNKNYLINHNAIHSFYDLVKFYSKLKWENQDLLIGKIGCVFDKTNLKLMILLNFQREENSLNVRILVKNKQIVKEFKEKFKIEENIVFNLFENFLII